MKLCPSKVKRKKMLVCQSSVLSLRLIPQHSPLAGGSHPLRLPQPHYLFPGNSQTCASGPDLLRSFGPHIQQPAVLLGFGDHKRLKTNMHEVFLVSCPCLSFISTNHPFIQGSKQENGACPGHLPALTPQCFCHSLLCPQPPG